MTTRDTISDFGDQTPTEPGKPPRAKRDSLVGTLRKKAVAAGLLLLVALFGYWTNRITIATEEAKGAAENAEAKGEQGRNVAAKVKVENQAGYDATREKVDASGEVLAELVAEVKALRAEVDQLKAARGRPRIRRPAVKVPPAVTEPLPATPAAAAQEKAAEAP